MSLVPGRGPLNAKICVIGEAPGKREDLLGMPFVGPSGKLQEKWIMDAGLRPEDIRYENVYPAYPPKGNINEINYEELKQWQEDCRARLDEMVNVSVIVPTGNVALATLLACAPWHAKITQRRGSIYLWEQASGRQIHVIPIIHPAAVLREEGEHDAEGNKKNYEYRCRMDWQKVRRELDLLHSPVPPYRNLVTQPPPAIWNDIVHTLCTQPAPIAFDIETNPDPAVMQMLCISFANSADFAVSVPFSAMYQEGIRTLLASPHEKVTQNGHYDNYWLRQSGYTVTNWRRDTMAKHCLLYPGEPHSLAYLASILTREPWYKGDDEDTGEKAWKSSNWIELLEYNAKDSAVTWECDAALDGQLTAKGMTQIYLDEYAALFEPIMDTMLHGINTDPEELREAFSVAITQAHAARRAAEAASGKTLFTFNTQVQEACWKVHTGEWTANDPEVAKKLKRAKGQEAKYIAQIEEKGISNDILKSILYDEMKLPIQRKRATGKTTVDEAALLKLRQRYKDTNRFPAAMALIDTTLMYREKKKQSEFLDPRRLDGDNRYRSSYSFRPTTGRLSSSSTPKNTGGNAQNIDRDLRRPFKPDEGCLLLEVDLSQAEARIVYVLTGDPQLLEFAQLRPSEFDVHTYMAREVFELPMIDFKKDRYLSKRIVHACIDKWTQVLTESGWIYADDYTGHAPIAVWEKEKRSITFETPAQWHEYEKPQDMWQIEGRTIDQLVTEGHTVPYMTNGTIKSSPVEDLIPSGNIPTSGYYSGSIHCDGALIRLVVATQADGHITPQGHLFFNMKKRRKITRLHTLLDAASIPYKAAIYGDIVRTKINKVDAEPILLKLSNKKFDNSLLQYDAATLENFLDELPRWDGYYGPTAQWYISNDIENIKWAQTIAHLRGKRARIQDGKRCWRLLLGDRQYASKWTKKKIIHNNTFKDEKVYCPTTSTGFFLIKRGVYISVTGNSHYHMHGNKCSEVLLKDGYSLSPKQCERLQSRYFNFAPGIAHWQQRTRMEVVSTRSLTNSWARRIEFPYQRFGDQLYRQAYAWRPQSDIARHLNRGWTMLHTFLKAGNYRSRVNLQLHDALLVSVYPEEAWPIAQYFVQVLEEAHNYYGVNLRIPTEIKLGHAWGQGTEWKQLPSQAEYEAAVEELLAA